MKTPNYPTPASSRDDQPNTGALPQFQDVSSTIWATRWNVQKHSQKERKGFSKRTFYAWLHGAVNLSLKRKNSTGTDNDDAHTHIAQKTEPLDLDIMPNVHANVGRP